jgi:hypothetical protein
LGKDKIRKISLDNTSTENSKKDCQAKGILMQPGKFIAHTCSLTGVFSSAVESTSTSDLLLSVDNSPLASTFP